MPSRERLRSIGQRQAVRMARDLATEARTLRVAAGLGQQRVASVVGVSRQWLADFEADRLRVLDARKVAIVYAVLGHKLVASAFPSGFAFRDAGQLRLIDRFAARVAPCWRLEREKVMPIPGDLRAWDLLLTGPVTIGVDAETRLSDLQAVERRMAAKQRDSRVRRTILLVAATDRNRTMLRRNIAAVRQTFPLDTRATLAALATGGDPGADALVVL